MLPKSLSYTFLNLKIKYKLLIAMFVMVTFACSLMSLTCYSYFVSLSEKTALTQTEESLEVLSSSLTRDIGKLYKDISYLVSGQSFINLVNDVEYNHQDNFTHHYLSIQNALDQTIRRNSLISNIILIGKNGETYGPIDMGIKPLGTIASEVNQLDGLEGISWFPSHQFSTVYLDSEYIPVIFPISLHTNSNLPLIVDQKDQTTLKLLVLIDTHFLNEQFNRINRTPFATVYLANEKGEPLSLPMDSPNYSLVNTPLVTSAIANTTEFSSLEVTLSEEDKDNHDTSIISCDPLSLNNLRFVSIISKDILLEGIGSIKIFTIFTLCISLSVSFVICLLLSRTLTAPLKQLSELVVTIDPSKDTPLFPTLYKDEIGILADAFNKMCKLIKSQVACIKADEKARHHAELNMLTHQINPHFLYNTLECIHWEILAQNSTSAALMVETLGDFLRLSLSSKENVISIENEISHTEKYIAIINHRTQAHIQFVTLVEPDLLNHQIVRLILQPCIENCIKHGFNNEHGVTIIPNPLICVSIYAEDHKLILSIEDNGKGIDIAKAKESLLGQSALSKVGLRNVYERLRVHYGEEIEVEFSSIPFYKNIVKFKLPLKVDTIV